MSVAAPAGKPQPLYFVNGPVDYLLIGGMSILTLAAFSLAGFSRTTVLPNSPGQVHWLIGLTGVLLWVTNWPHFAASSYRLYHSKANVRQYPMTALVVPWVVLAFAVGAFLAPAVVAPYFVKLFLVWSPYHFSGQTIGVTLIYFRRAGIRIGKWQRLALSTFVYGTFVSMNVNAEFGIAQYEYYGIKYPTFGLPDWGRETLGMPLLSLIPMVAMYAGGIGFLLLSAKWMADNKRVMPPILFVPALTQFVWFVYAAGWSSYVQLVPFFHSLQYMLIAWSMQMKETLDRTNAKPGLGFVLKATGVWGGMIFLGGAILFWPEYGLPMWASKLFGTDIMTATGIVLAAIQVHHFFVDGVIWKLKSKSVSSPLMMNLDDLIHEKAATPTVPIDVATPAPMAIAAEPKKAKKGKHVAVGAGS